MNAKALRIGTRGSLLALAQANDVRARLAAANGLALDAIEIVVIKTSGDRIQDRALSEVGGKGLFTKEIEEALIAGEIELAVHSMKDLETKLPAGLVISTVLPREDVRDAFISLKHTCLADVPRGAVVGTSSLRRQAQLKRLRPDLEIVGFRGNVQTRLQKLADGVAEATILATAGLNRLGQSDRITRKMETDEMLPAVAQGAVGVEIRADDERTAALLAPLNDDKTALAVTAERAFLALLDGSCRTPIAGLAEIKDGQFRLRGELLATDGSAAWSAERTGSPAEALMIADAVAQDILSKAGRHASTGS